MANRDAVALLPPDRARTALAAAIALVTASGWIVSLMRPQQRGALPYQTTIWWIEQIVGLALVVVCIGIVMRKPAFFRPAMWLAGYSLLFDVMRWLLGYAEGDFVVPVGLIMYALFLWRLRLTRRTMAGSEPETVSDAAGESGDS